MPNFLPEILASRALRSWSPNASVLPSRAGRARRLASLAAGIACAWALGAGVSPRVEAQTLAPTLGQTGALTNVQDTSRQPKPIDPGTAVTARPLDDASADASATRSADDALRADYERRQKVIDRRTAENDYAYGVKQHDCYSKFFVNHCLDNARTQMRETRQQIRHDQLALDDEQRTERANERDRQTALKQAQYMAEAPQRAANEQANQKAYEDRQRQNALAAAQRQAEAPQRAANQAAYDRKQADYQKQLDEARAKGVQEAQERADKAERYDQKQKEAAQHRAEVEARQQEAARKQAEKAQQAQAEQQRQEQLKQQQQQQGQ